jgi:hypothetical protein
LGTQNPGGRHATGEKKAEEPFNNQGSESDCAFPFRESQSLFWPVGQRRIGIVFSTWLLFASGNPSDPLPAPHRPDKQK